MIKDSLLRKKLGKGTYFCWKIDERGVDSNYLMLRRGSSNRINIKRQGALKIIWVLLLLL